MNTSTDPRPEPRSPRTLRPFHTPVRGHAFARRPPGGAPLARTPLRLRAEPDNPADPHAVAVWAEGGGAPWRVGYLERAVAARLAPHGRPDELDVSFAGWWEEPEGRWRRPVVRVALSGSAPATGPRGGVRDLPPARVARVVRAA